MSSNKWCLPDLFIVKHITFKHTMPSPLTIQHFCAHLYTIISTQIIHARLISKIQNCIMINIYCINVTSNWTKLKCIPWQICRKKLIFFPHIQYMHKISTAHCELVKLSSSFSLTTSRQADKEYLPTQPENACSVPIICDDKLYP